MAKGKKYDEVKFRYDLIPPEVLKALAEVFTFGAAKYAANSWQDLPDFEERYYAALERHLQAHRMGERTDQESGMLHLAHAAVNTCFLLWKELQKEQPLFLKIDAEVLTTGKEATVGWSLPIGDAVILVNCRCTKKRSKVPSKKSRKIVKKGAENEIPGMDADSHLTRRMRRPGRSP